MPVLNSAANVMAGAAQAKRVYRGTDLVWPPGPTNVLAAWTNSTTNTITWTDSVMAGAVYDVYYSPTELSDWTTGTLVGSGIASGVQSAIHTKDSAAQNQTILYYGVVARKGNAVSLGVLGSAPRVRGGTDWKPITIAPKSNKVQALYHVASGASLDASLVATGGNYTVDWGDGTAATNHADGALALHTYTYSSMPATGEIATGRQAMATISAQSGQTMTGLALMGAIAPPPSPPTSPAAAHNVLKGPAPWKYSYVTDQTYVSEPRNIQTVWVKITPVATGSYTIFEDGGEDTYGYLYAAAPVGPGYDNYIAEDDDAGPGSGYQITATLTGGTTYYIASTYYYYQLGGTRPMRVNVTGGPTVGAGNDLGFPVEVSVASDHLRSLDVKKAADHTTGVNFLSKISADSFDHMFDNMTALANVCGEMKCLGTSAAYMFNYCTALRTPSPSLETTGVTDFKYMFRRCNNAAFTTLPPLDTSAGTDFSWMFASTWYVTSAPASYSTSNGTDFSYMYAGTNLLAFPAMDTSNGTNFENMFESTKAGAVIPAINTSKGTNFKGMFQFSNNIIVPLLDTSNGTDFSYMFGDSYVASVPAFNTGKGINFQEMFNGAYNTALTTLPTFDTKNGTNFKYMFAGLTEVSLFPVTDVSKGTDFTGMFYNCWKLTSANLPAALTTGGGTSLGTFFQEMFYGCKSTGFTTAPAMNTVSGTDFSSMFRGCTYLTAPPAYNLGNATTVANMFYNCTALTSNGSVTYNTSKVTNFTGMFYSCSNAGFTVPPTLTSTAAGVYFLDMHNFNSYITAMPNYDTGNGTNFAKMFYYCSRLVNAGSRVYNTAKGTNFYQTFYGCSNTGFTTIPAWNMGAGTEFYQVFRSCTYVTLINAYGMRYSINIEGVAPSMSAANLNTFYTNLGTANNSGGQQTVTVSTMANHGTSNKSIATAKGWAVLPP